MALVMVPQYTPANSRTSVGFMFLGGPLDHAIRTVPRDDHDRRMPRITEVPHISAETDPRKVLAPGGAPLVESIYKATRCKSGSREWWCFILEGYDPPARHLLDADPFWI